RIHIVHFVACAHLGGGSLDLPRAGLGGTVDYPHGAGDDVAGAHGLWFRVKPRVVRGSTPTRDGPAVASEGAVIAPLKNWLQNHLHLGVLRSRKQVNGRSRHTGSLGHGEVGA